jgi:hypothetical protein
MKSAAKPQVSTTKTRLPVKPDTPNTRAAKTAPAAPPAYLPQPVPKVLQTKMATTPPARDARKTPAAPPVYRPQPSRIQAKSAGPNSRRGPTHKGVIQRHPMLVTIGKTTVRKMDTGDFQSIEDVTQHLPQGAASFAISAVHIRKESNADHQYVIAITNGGINLKMHLGTAGAEIKFGAGISATFGIDRGRFEPKRGMTLGDAVGIFYQLAHEHAFESDNYNCARFAADLAARLGTYIREKGDDFDAFF